MGSRLVATFEVDGASKRDIRSALEGLADDDLSASSPISAGGREAAVVVDGDVAFVKVVGHDGDWTKKSTAAVTGAVEDVAGVVSVAEVEGGYESPDSGDESGDNSSDDGDENGGE